MSFRRSSEMPVLKLSSSSAGNMLRLDDGNDSIDTLIRQSTGNEPLISFSRTGGESPVQLIQLLHALDQQDHSGWPFPTVKLQMHKCDKCSQEFVSLINYRRHIRVHRRSFKIDKESQKYRNLLGAFWDKLSVEEIKEIVSFKDATLEEIHGSAILKGLVGYLRKPGIWSYPQVYVRASSTLLDIIQAKPSRFPISSEELFGILEDATERTFLCAGTAESVQKYVFDGEAAKVALETRNLVACAGFLFELKLVKAWLANKDAEALRCQQLLVEEEEAEQKRHAELLERKKQKKLRQKQQKARAQSNGRKIDLNVTTDMLEGHHSIETYSPPTSSVSSCDNADISEPADSPSHVAPVSFSENLDDGVVLQSNFSNHYLDSGLNANVDSQLANADVHEAVNQWQVPKPQRTGRYGSQSNQNHPSLKREPALRRIPSRGSRPHVNIDRTLVSKIRGENVEDNTREHSQKAETLTDQGNCKVLIGSISVPLRNCAINQQDGSPIEDHDARSDTRRTMQKNNFKFGTEQSGTIEDASRHHVSQHETSNPVLMLIQSVHRDSRDANILENVDDQTLSNKNLLLSSRVFNDDSKSTKPPLLGEVSLPEVLPLHSDEAQAFLAERWKEAISADHVKLVLSRDIEPPERPHAQENAAENQVGLTDDIGHRSFSRKEAG